MSTQQNVTLHCRGLFTYPNLLGEIPDGALTTADNVVIDRDGVASPRRGFAEYGDNFGVSSTRAKQLLTYKGRIFRHWLTTIDYDSDGAGTFDSLAIDVTEQAPGSRIKYLEANGNFYFTSNAGIKKISAVVADDILADINSAIVLTGNTYATGTPFTIDGISNTANLTFGMQVFGPGIALETIIVGIPNSTSVTINIPATITATGVSLTFNDAIVTPAGGIEALDGVGTLNSTPGWFLPNSEVAYRIVWGITDANGNLVLGTPSDRIIVDNPGISASVGSFNQLIAQLNAVATASPVILTGNTTGITVTGNTTAPITISGNTYAAIFTTGDTNQTTTISAIPSTTGILPGMFVVGPGIQAGTTVVSTTSSTAVISLPTLTSVPVPPAVAPANIMFYQQLIDGISSTSGLVSGMTITGSGILSGTTITSVNTHSIGISSIATATATAVSVVATSDVISSISPNTTGLSTGMTIIGSNITLGSTIVEVLSPSSILISTTPSTTVTGESLTFPISTISGISSTSQLSIGMTVTGTGILPNTTIFSIPNSTSIVIDTFPTVIETGATFTFAQVLNDPNFLDLLIPASSSSTTLYNALIALTQELDTDLGESTYFGKTGAITQIIPTSSITTTGNTAIGYPQITNIPSTVNLIQGMIVNGSGIPLNSTIVSIDSASQITLNSTIEVNQTTITFNALFNTQVVSTDHGLVTGDLITIAGTNSSPNIDTTTPVPVTVIDANTFTVQAQTSTGGNQGTWTEYPLGIAQSYLTPPLNPPTGQDIINLQAFFNAIVNALNTDTGISTYALSTIGGAFSLASTSATANVIFPIPDGVTGAYFYQVYRSDMALAQNQTLFSEITADDELRLIAENNPSLAQLTAKFIDFYDNVPESYRLNGANLYTNAISGEGILQENNIPPLAQDIALYQGSTFYANTVEKQSLQVNLLTAVNLIGQTLTITSGGVPATYTFVRETYQQTTITLPAGSVFASGINPANYFTIFSANNLAQYTVWFNVNGTGTAPIGTGGTLIPCIIFSTDSSAQVTAKLLSTMISIIDFTTTLATPNELLVVNDLVGPANNPVSFLPIGFVITVTVTGGGNNTALKLIGVAIQDSTPAQAIDDTARNILYVINTQVNSPIQVFYLSGPTDLPGQMNFEAITMGAPPFYLTSSFGTAFDPALPSTGTSVVSNNSPSPNRLYFSKYQQPESVPLVNYQDIGPKDKAILRILPLRDCLFVLKEDGVYQLTGQQIANFTIYPFDTSTKLKAADSAVVLNNQIYMFSDQGVVTISSTGVSVISRPIENLLLPVIGYNDYTSATFGVTYETDRAYLLWTLTNPTDAVATTCYRYNTFTTTWVSWSIEKTCGVVVPETNILYLGAGDTDFIEQERKTYTRLDHADRQFTLNVPINAVNGANLSLGSLFNINPGDALVQTQYLTVSQFNRLCNKLDLDHGTTNNYSTILATPGVNIRTSLSTLAALLDTEPHGPWTGAYSAAIAGFGSDFVSCQNAFNVIIGLLNDDPGAKFHSYATSTGTVGLETTVASVNIASTTIVVSFPLAFIQGPIIRYQNIDSQVVWAPHTFGDTSMLKKVSESTIIFNTMDFTKCVISYASDLSPGFITIPVPGEGNGVWNEFFWGQTTWGGDGTSRPIRTYIPYTKQRSRFMVGKFEHATALESYDIFGISFTWEPVSSRAYR